MQLHHPGRFPSQGLLESAVSREKRRWIRVQWTHLMRSTATVLARIVTGAIIGLAIAAAWAQSPATKWYPVGNSLVDLSLAGLASGPVERVWYSVDGSTLYATT